MDNEVAVGIFTLGGVVVGSVATLAMQWLRRKDERLNLRRLKLEHIVNEAYAADEWLRAGMYAATYEQTPPKPATISPLPFDKCMALASLYFPELIPEAKELSSTCRSVYVHLIENHGRVLTAPMGMDTFDTLYSNFGVALLKLVDKAAKLMQEIT